MINVVASYAIYIYILIYINIKCGDTSKEWSTLY